MKTKLTIKGQITIPIEIRRKLNLEAGQELEFDPTTPYLRATKVVNENEMRSVRGICKDKLRKSSVELVKELRDGKS